MVGADDLSPELAHSNFYRYVAGGRTSSISACRSLLGVSRCDATVTSVIWASDMTGWSAASPGPLRRIDGPNFYATAKALAIDIDYKRVLKEFESRGTLI